MTTLFHNVLLFFTFAIYVCFKLCSWDLIFFSEPLVYSVIDYSINIVKIQIINLNFFSKITQCPF